MRLSKVVCFVVTLILAAPIASAPGAEADALVLKNQHVLRELRRVDGSWRTVRFARADGSDAIAVESDEFHILPLDSEQGWTVADYVAIGPPVREEAEGVSTVCIAYRQRRPLPARAPQQVTMTYTLGEGPTHYKTVALVMQEGDVVDRLQIERFSTEQRASRGGFGQPVFIANWFFGIEYPGFYSWHSNGCTAANGYAVRPTTRPPTFASPPRATYSTPSALTGRAKHSSLSRWAATPLIRRDRLQV